MPPTCRSTRVGSPWLCPAAMPHHVVEWEKALAEANRVLKPGGMLVGFDLLHVADSRRPHRRRHHSGEREHQAHHPAGAKRLVDPDAFERELARLPLTGVRVRRSVGVSPSDSWPPGRADHPRHRRLRGVIEDGRD